MVANNFADMVKERLLDPEAWEQTAHHLFSAARFLEPKVEEFTPALDATVRRYLTKRHGSGSAW